MYCTQGEITGVEVILKYDFKIKPLSDMYNS